MQLLVSLRRQDDRLRLGAFTVWCIAWLAVVWAMLHPAPPPLEQLSDKLVHFMSFLAVSMATVAFCRTAWQFLLAGGFCAAAGVGLEVAQAFTPTRAFEWRDMAANLSGTAVGITAAVVLLLVLEGSQLRAERATRRPARGPI